ncbi:hypothetical protein [Ignicoccus hospitalis]|uniref:hypothetical protein n=1 Tax=Ignicoccus hospitalis TaxID=160233 RepID=UPI0003260C89|nr:hypothetical protein [Ignicoccus hospitalis]HIH90693.1 hypothetical protein [Desulfurococcaceae archaeon]
MKLKRSLSESDVLIAMIIIIVALWTFGKEMPPLIKVGITTTILFLFMSIALVIGSEGERE